MSLLPEPDSLLEETVPQYMGNPAIEGEILFDGGAPADDESSPEFSSDARTTIAPAAAAAAAVADFELPSQGISQPGSLRSDECGEASTGNACSGEEVGAGGADGCTSTRDDKAGAHVSELAVCDKGFFFSVSYHFYMLQDSSRQQGRQGYSNLTEVGR